MERKPPALKSGSPRWTRCGNTPFSMHPTRLIVRGHCSLTSPVVSIGWGLGASLLVVPPAMRGTVPHGSALAPLGWARRLDFAGSSCPCLVRAIAPKFGHVFSAGERGNPTLSVAGRGFEPLSPAKEAGMLPLHQPAIFSSRKYPRPVRAGCDDAPPKFVPRDFHSS